MIAKRNTQDQSVGGPVWGKCGLHVQATCSKRLVQGQSGITLIELILVLAILGIVIGIGALSGRGALTGQQERAAIRSIQQSVWQGASAASARGRNTELVHIGNRIEVREVESGRSIRSEELPSGIVTNLPNLIFTPPGKISAESFAGVADGISVQSSAGTTVLRVSIIGEVVAEKE